MKTIYLNGQFLKTNVQIIDAFTPGVFSARGVFETMLGLDGMVLDIALHLKRLKEGLNILGIKSPTINPLVFKDLLRRNQLVSARVRLMVWQSGRQVPVMAVALPYKPPVKKIFRVCLIKTDRLANDHLANVKSLDYELFAECYKKAQENGFDEALLVNRLGNIFEASRANIFWIKDKVLYTPPLSSGCLNGIIRQQVIKQALSLKTTVKEKNLTLDVLARADAAFLTNSLIGIKPIELAGIRKSS